MKQQLSSALIAFALATALVTPAFAMEGGRMMGAKSSVDIACMKTAVDARENALMTAWGTFNTSMAAAYAARKAALDAAWVMTDGKARNAAIKTAWTAFNTAKKTAMKQWNTDRKAAWSAFRAAAKACHGTSDTDAGGEAMDQ